MKTATTLNVMHIQCTATSPLWLERDTRIPSAVSALHIFIHHAHRNPLHYHWQMSRFPPHQNRHSSCSRAVFFPLDLLHPCQISPPVTKALLFSNLWHLSHWPRQTGCSRRERMPKTVVTSNTWVTALLRRSCRNGCAWRETANAALMWHPKLWHSRIASSRLHPFPKCCWTCCSFTDIKHTSTTSTSIHFHRFN